MFLVDHAVHGLSSLRECCNNSGEIDYVVQYALIGLDTCKVVNKNSGDWCIPAGFQCMLVLNM